MKNIRKFCGLLLLLVVCASASLQAQSYDKLWKQVEEAQKKGLPKTVVKWADEIYRKGTDEHDIPQMLKAYICREAYQERLTPDSLYSNLQKLERWARVESNTVGRSVLYSLLSAEYLDYLQGNRYAASLRTELDEETPSADIREWSKAQFIRKIDEYSQASLQAREELLAMSSDAYVPFVKQEDGSRFYGHNMYDLLARRAITVYNALGGWDVDSLMHERVERIYLDRLQAYSHHAGMEDALLLTTLDYWQWKYDHARRPVVYNGRSAVKTEWEEDYLAMLDSLIATYGTREVCAEVYIRKAELLQDGFYKRYAEAVKVCDEGIERYPKYKRTNELKNIRQRLLQPYVRLTFSPVVYPGDTLEVKANYRNLSGFTLNLYRVDAKKVPLELNELDEDYYSKHGVKVASLHHDGGTLTDDRIFQYTDTTLTLKLPDRTGIYLLQAVPDVKGAKTDEDFLALTRLMVLSLPLLDDKKEICVVDAHSGWPVEGAKVTFYSGYSGKDRKQLAEVTTGTGGKAVLSWNTDIRFYKASVPGDVCMPLQNIYRGGGYQADGRETPQERVTLLTDRSIYRPGQTVYVKGIAYRQQADEAQVLEGKAYVLRLLDANGKALSTQEVRTNDFGSFAADFTLPSACLNGNFTIDIQGKASTSIRVEEYKRPTFAVTIHPLKEAYCLGDTVCITGKVETFNGVSVQDVDLAYVVNRSAGMYRWPVKWQPVVSDTIRLDAEGNFSFPVVMKGADENGYFASFQVSVTVTDGAGETQAESYEWTVTREPYSFMGEIDRELCKEDTLSATFTVMNAANQQQALQGTYRLYAIRNFSEKGVSGQPVIQGTFTSGQKLLLEDWNKLPSGCYRLVLAAPWRDREVSNLKDNAIDLLIFSLSDKRLATFRDVFLYQQNTDFEADGPAVFYFGTSHKDAYVMVDVFSPQARLESRTVVLNDTLVRMEFPYKEVYGKGVSVQLTFVKDGQPYISRVELRKPQPDRTLDMKWEVFRDRLQPGQEEEWKLVIKTPQGLPAAAEMLATMYDASLDKLFKRYQSLGLYYSYYLPYLNWQWSTSGIRSISPYFPIRSWRVPEWYYDRFYHPFSGVGEVLTIVENDAAVSDVVIRGYASADRVSATGRVPAGAMLSKAENGEAVEVKYVPAAVEEELSEVVFESETLPIEPAAELSSEVRTNFAETAFFYPQLRTNELGEIAFSFTMPQSLTRWNFCAWSHTKDMMTGQLTASTVTSKEFMLMPNLPRFVRTGDKTQVAATVANLTDREIKGKVVLTLFDPVTGKNVLTRRQSFTVEARRNTSVTFAFDVTDRYDLLGIRMVADGGTFSDGEQHLLPVLSNSAYLTETLAMPIRGKETRTFRLDSLFNGHSNTATHRRLTVEFTGNPAWYAVQALPVLGQQETDNAVSWATAWYANSLAGYIAGSQPRIKAVFDSWKATGASKETFLSQLEKNQDVKNILLSESPWVLEATNEAEQRARIATLFDVNQLGNRLSSALVRLKDLQGDDGAWSWYKGMPGSRDMTSYITTLLVRLPLMTGVRLDDEADAMKQAAFGYLNREAQDEYKRLRKQEKKGAKVDYLSDTALEWLYLLALDGTELPAEMKPVRDYFLAKAGNGLTSASMSRKARVAIVLLKNGKTAQGNDFIASLREHLVQEDEMGAHFAFYDTPYRWGMMPVPVHVSVMEALRMAGGNDALVEEMKLWLLKQKQTTSWTSPVATADAIYALLRQGTDLLESRGDVHITLGREVLETQKAGADAPAGLSYIKQSFTEGSSLKAREITVEKRDEGIAWGAVYAQYLSPMSDVRQQGGALDVQKKLYVERVAADGSRSLKPLAEAGPLHVGDKVVSRLTIRLDRAMDFVQLKDQRGACFEPIGSLSGYRWGNGLGYYVEIEDAATNFFFDHLGKGTYVLEHSYRVARGGTYQSGLATLQCAYAPEYASHAAGGMVTVE